MRRVGKKLLLTAGILSTGFGLLGVFIPVLPTTPFLLLAASCFMRSSERFYNWLIYHRAFGTYIRNYRDHRAMTLRGKLFVLTLLWVTIGTTVIVILDTLWVRLLLLAIACGVTAHIVLLKTTKHGN